MQTGYKDRSIRDYLIRLMRSAFYCNVFNIKKSFSA